MPTNIPAQTDSPRTFADKSTKTPLHRAIDFALRVESSAVRHNTQTFNRGRYAAVAAIPDYDALKDRARAIKERSLENLPGLLAELEASVTRNGGHFFLAQDAQKACQYIAEVCSHHGARLAVKGKSMTAEEIHLNPALAAAGIEVVETDLAEFILQVADEQPSHNIAPAIHYSRERISALFKRVFRTDLPLETGEELTAFARELLREKFLRADVGISGANLIAADSGTLVLVESEANIRMASLVPPVHIAVAGIEKIVPTRADFAPFIELLAASATGQPMTSYTSVISPPLDRAPVLTDGPVQRREFHLVVVDNGRIKMRQDPVLLEALYCIRCGACLNSCANFQTVGGHAFGGETYSGGIGGAWEAGTRGIEHARFSELCTGCSRCVAQCPVRIDIPWLNTVLRQRLDKHDATTKSWPWASVLSGTSGADSGASLEKLFFGRYDLFAKVACRFAGLSNWVQRRPAARLLLEKCFGVDRRRTLPPFARVTLLEACRREPGNGLTAQAPSPRATAVLFADVFTNFGSPERGLAAIKILRRVGIDLILSEVSPDGRAALSQGLISTAAEQAKRTAALLGRYMDTDRDIVVIEPSVLAMFRLDYRHLLEGSAGQALFQKLRARTFEAVEYLWNFLHTNGFDPAELFPAARHPLGTRLFYHRHCQQKTIGAAEATEALLRAAGFDVATSTVECCGMAGSFGYKKEFYELSMAVGEDLFREVKQADSLGGTRILVASGVSCHEQLQAGLNRRVYHPMELLAEIVQPISTG